MIYGIDEIKRLEDLNKEWLDSLDLRPFVHAGDDVSYIVEQIEENFSSDPTMPEELEGEVFNFLADADVADYLSKRYDLKVWEEVEVHYYLH